jgi:aminopeptidase C
MIPTPSEIFARYERGQIEREELHALMALNARELIAEMEEDRLNPAAALLEYLLCRRAAARLVRKHGGRLLREILHALSLERDFPPSRLLWNASHPDVPLHCFLRMRKEPVFRVDSIATKDGCVVIEVEHGAAGKGDATRRTFTLKRGTDWKLRVAG